MQMLVQPFDPNQFNFNRVKEKEVLFEVRRRRKDEGQDTAEGEGHMIAVNVSPIDRGHVLLVPEPSSCLPQVMTLSSLQLCLELVSLSGHSGFCMVANSLLAYASVNHLHYHFLYIDHPHLPARTLGGREVNGTRGCYQLTRHYVRGFGFQLDSDPQSCARAIFQVVSLLLVSGVPYNIAMLRGPPFSDPHAPSDPRHPPSAPPSLVRTILIPRKPVLGLKQLYQRVGPPPPLFAASCELALGLIPVMDMETYATITEEEIVAILKEQELTEDEFSALVDKLSSYNETKS
ncbi:GDP-D-glucose phosphorylase 1 [Geodia barretti]|nr:GDP-D-glucose phosphorylase 1 [Geodia barretti]